MRYLSRPSTTSTETYITAYFEWFHPSFPLLHQPTFGNETPEVLKNIVTAIGCLYTARTLSDENASSCVKLSRNLWDTGRRSLARLVCVLCFSFHVLKKFSHGLSDFPLFSRWALTGKSYGGHGPCRPGYYTSSTVPSWAVLPSIKRQKRCCGLVLT